MDKTKRDALKRVCEVFHKYMEWEFVAGTDPLILDEMKAEYTANKNAPIPTYDEMKEQIFSKLMEKKFRFIQVAPEKANCAVRIFRKELEVDGKPGGLCGAECFVKNPLGKWTTINRWGDEIEMTYEETYEVEYWVSHVFFKPVMANYYDVYLKVVIL